MKPIKGESNVVYPVTGLSSDRCRCMGILAVICRKADQWYSQASPQSSSDCEPCQSVHTHPLRWIKGDHQIHDLPFCRKKNMAYNEVKSTEKEMSCRLLPQWSSGNRCGCSSALLSFTPHSKSWRLFCARSGSHRTLSYRASFKKRESIRYTDFLFVFCGCGETGKRRRLKIFRRKVYGFESHHPHYIRRKNMSYNEMNL